MYDSSNFVVGLLQRGYDFLMVPWARSEAQRSRRPRRRVARRGCGPEALCITLILSYDYDLLNHTHTSRLNISLLGTLILVMIGGHGLANWVVSHSASKHAVNHTLNPDLVLNKLKFSMKSLMPLRSYHVSSVQSFVCLAFNEVGCHVM